MKNSKLTLVAILGGCLSFVLATCSYAGIFDFLKKDNVQYSVTTASARAMYPGLKNRVKFLEVANKFASLDLSNLNGNAQTQINEIVAKLHSYNKMVNDMAIAAASGKQLRIKYGYPAMCTAGYSAAYILAKGEYQQLNGEIQKVKMQEKYQKQADAVVAFLNSNLGKETTVKLYRDLLRQVDGLTYSKCVGL